MLTIESECSKCGETYTWKSQPDFLGKFPAGNILLSFAVLCAGASIRKVLLVFRHMGLLVYHEPTYYYHQRHLLIPSIVAFWRKYQNRLLERLTNQEVVLAGDGRHDSMGHSAKYGTYTIFCCTAGLIIHIVLMQVPCHFSFYGIEIHFTAIKLPCFKVCLLFLCNNVIVSISFNFRLIRQVAVRLWSSWHSKRPSLSFWVQGW